MAVYTSLTSEDKTKIKTLYNLSEDADFIEISEGILNTNYLVKDGDKKYIFRLLEGERNIEEELKELDFLKFLNENGISCPEAFINTSGKNHMFIQEQIGSLFNFMDGEKVHEINDDILKTIGSILGKMHNL